ncbi:hypothetical protein [Maritimibacter sp. DP1N21-5]|uniref:hypothetical protein n=1 Tax=Maritimibacter sp. DP1N21-5 TaxID=2836867 RepID=UPI001C46416D|nr:hypothetical protein [Maritimibacter sp. DP1N21-5]MBV7410517.1 hypothetical protein [Maritimibacter sp. DP1N21-5]
MKTLIATPLLITALIAAPQIASAFDDSDRAGVEARVATFEAAFTSRDYAGVLDVLPPRLLDFMSEELDIPRAELADTMTKQMGIFLSDVTIDAFAMDTASMTTGETPEGTTYAFIPTTTTFTSPEIGTRTLESQTLALEEGGAWYLTRIEMKQQYDIVKGIYPGFAGIPLPD